VCDLEPENGETAASEFGFRTVYTDYLEMIEREQPDGCVCVMPIPLIAGLAIDLLRRGMPVTIEKPVGDSLQAAQDALTAARETCTPNMVSVNRRFQPLIRRAIGWAREQGPLRYVRASMLRGNRTEPTFMSGTAIHCIDALREIGGEITDYGIRTHGGTPRWFHVWFDFASGAMGGLDVLPTSGSVEERYELFGDGYRADVRAECSPHPRLRCWKSGDLVLDERPALDEPHFVRLGPYAETDEFVTALADKRRPWPSVEEIYPSLEIAYRLDPSQSTDRRR
jgi:predicted dehydrogenase